jgi:predicted DNA-binding protein
MSKTVTLRLDDKNYEIIKKHAQADNRPLSNYIETATLKYIEEIDYVDDYEMEQILNDKELLESLKRGSADAATKKGRFVG